MDLQNPENKMSKSADSPMGTVCVTDTPEVIAKKVKIAVTDSGREVVAAPDKPALTNLLTIYSVATGQAIPEAEATFAGKGYADFKKGLTESLVEFLRPVRERYAELMADQAELARLLSVGAEKAQAVASKTLAEVYEAVGFLPLG
jgi:tryptophanyl-tRNA synthetase